MSMKAAARWWHVLNVLIAVHVLLPLSSVLVFGRMTGQSSLSFNDPDLSLIWPKLDTISSPDVPSSEFDELEGKNNWLLYQTTAIQQRTYSVDGQFKRMQTKFSSNKTFFFLVRHYKNSPIDIFQLERIQLWRQVIARTDHVMRRLIHRVFNLNVLSIDADQSAWGGDCNGKRQSPINIAHHRTKITKLARIGLSSGFNRPLFNATLINTGHSGMIRVWRIAYDVSMSVSRCYFVSVFRSSVDRSITGRTKGRAYRTGAGLRLLSSETGTFSLGTEQQHWVGAHHQRSSISARSKIFSLIFFFFFYFFFFYPNHSIGRAVDGQSLSWKQAQSR